MIFKNLPKEIINIILDFEGKIKFIKGKYKLNLDNIIYDCIKQNIKNKIYVMQNIPDRFRKFV